MDPTASPASVGERLQSCEAEIRRLRSEIEKRKSELQNGGLSSFTVHKRPLVSSVKRRRTLTGHLSKVYAMCWNSDGEHLVSAGQDGRLLYWDAVTGHKLISIPLATTWVMACTMDRWENKLVGCGGLDNTCSLYDLTSTSTKPIIEIQGHDGYLSGCKFMDSKTMVTCSGDSTCATWDLNRGVELTRFIDHNSDVLSLSVSPTQPTVFVSGSVDSTAKVWDARVGPKCVQTFVGHASDVNSVQFLPHGLGFVTGGDDCTMKVFDLRSYARLNEFAHSSIIMPITCVDVSVSGRLVVGGCTDANAYAWDTLVEAAPGPVYTLTGHSNTVSCVAYDPHGCAIATSSWDNEIGLWA